MSYGIVVTFKRLQCSRCDKLRSHEIAFGLARCALCGQDRGVDQDFVIERFNKL